MAEPSGGRKPAPKLPARRAPIRTCVACQESSAKRELVRIVHTTAGSVEVDATGKKAGRGAYLCRKRICWQTAFKKHALERALKTTINPENMAQLEQYAATLE
jgi:hypothetical protein